MGRPPSTKQGGPRIQSRCTRGGPGTGSARSIDAADVPDQAHHSRAAIRGTAPGRPGPYFGIAVADTDANTNTSNVAAAHGFSIIERLTATWIAGGGEVPNTEVRHVEVPRSNGGGRAGSAGG
jgi:hypothetical protein